MNGWLLLAVFGPPVVWAAWRTWQEWRRLVDADPFARPVDGLTDVEWEQASEALRRIGAAR